MAVTIMTEPAFLYRCADLLCKLAERLKKERVYLTPEIVANEATGLNKFSAEELRSLGEILKLLSLMMEALVVTRDSVIEQLTKRIIELEEEKQVMLWSRGLTEAELWGLVEIRRFVDGD